MKVIREIHLQEFDFYGKAKDNFESLSDEQIELAEQELNELYPTGLSGIALNNLFGKHFNIVKSLINKTQYGVVISDYSGIIYNKTLTIFDEAIELFEAYQKPNTKGQLTKIVNNKVVDILDTYDNIDYTKIEDENIEIGDLE